jgi:hypothetical protein
MAKIYVKENRFATGIELLGRSTQTFPSGLGRADLVFLVENKFLENARGQLNVDDAVPLRNTISPNLARQSETGEGFVQSEDPGGRTAYIFPSPVEKKDVPGFTKFFVSAYYIDRPTRFNEILNQQFVEVSKSFTLVVPAEEEEEEPITYNWTTIERWSVDVITRLSVAPSQTPSLNLPRPTTEPKEVFLGRKVTGRVAPGVSDAIEISWELRTVSISRRPFGRYAESEVTVTLIPNY